MARTPVLNLRVDAETKAGWERAATKMGVPLSEFIRAAVDEFVAKLDDPSVAASLRRPPARSIHTGGKRTYQPDPK